MNNLVLLDTDFRVYIRLSENGHPFSCLFQFTITASQYEIANIQKGM